MAVFYGSLLAVLSFTFYPYVQAQINLSEVPVASCAGNVVSGTATYSTDMFLPTEKSQRIPPGGFWDQSGAVWEFSTDTPGVKFGYASIPGIGTPSADIPQADVDAIVIDDSSTVWRLSVPTPSVGKYDIVFGVATQSATAATSSAVDAATTSASGITTAATATATDGTQANRRRNRAFDIPLPLSVEVRRQPTVGVRFRRAPQANSEPPAGQYHLIITGIYPCADEPGLGLQPQPSHTGTSDPRIVTACSQNSILPSSAAWSAYAVNIRSDPLINNMLTVTGQ